MTLPELVRDEHHGVPVLTSDIRSTFTGSLVFAVGVVDETARSAGITHLVEHLVMATVGPVTVSHNASTEDDRLVFYAEGPEDSVGLFLNRVAAAIGDLPSVGEATVAEQRKVIAAELGDQGDQTGLGPLLDRFGASTLGLLDVGSPAHRSHTREQALDWAARWLHAGNAVLTFSGPVPDTLDLRLPAARESEARQDIVALDHRRHGWVAGGTAPLALSLYLEADDRSAVFLASVVMQRALHDELRGRRQLAYSVNGYSGRVDQRTRYVSFVLDPRPEDIVDAAQAALATLRNLATDGPGDALLDHVRAEEREAGHHSEVQLEHLLGAAAAWLRFGMEPRSLAELSTDTVTGDHVRDVLHRALDTLLVSLGPIDTPSEPDELAAILGLPWAKGPDCHYAGMSNVARMKALMASDVEILSPRLFKGARGQQLILDPSRITWSVGSVGVIEVTWNEIVMAGECVDCGHWDLTDYAGDGFVVEPSKWRGGEKAVDAMRRNIPESLRYEIRHQVPAS